MFTTAWNEKLTIFKCFSRLFCWHSNPISYSLSRDARLFRRVHRGHRGACRTARATSKCPAWRVSAQFFVSGEMSHNRVKSDIVYKTGNISFPEYFAISRRRNLKQYHVHVEASIAWIVLFRCWIVLHILILNRYLHLDYLRIFWYIALRVSGLWVFRCVAGQV